MDEVSCLIFELDPYRYAIESNAVAGVLKGSSVAPKSAAQAIVLGEAQVDGDSIPVLSLHRLLGQAESARQPAETLVVVQGRDGRVALAPDRVTGTRMLPLQGSVRMHKAGGEKPQAWKFVTRLVSIDHTLVMVLDADAIARAATDEAVAAALEFELPHAVHEDHDPERLADSLFEDLQAARVMVVIRWNGREYGVPLEQVEEFGEATALRRLPGCPVHIRGQAVLRGDLVTVVDVRAAMGLPLPETASSMTLVVLQQDGERIGVVVDEVREMMTPMELHPPGAGAPTFVMGSFVHGPTSLDILDLQMLLARDEIVVGQRL